MLHRSGIMTSRYSSFIHICCYEEHTPIQYIVHYCTEKCPLGWRISIQETMCSKLKNVDSYCSNSKNIIKELIIVMTTMHILWHLCMLKIVNDVKNITHAKTTCTFVRYGWWTCKLHGKCIITFNHSNEVQIIQYILILFMMEPHICYLKHSAVITLSIFSQILTIDFTPELACEGEVWVVCCNSKIWFTFCHRYHVCNNMMN